MSFGEPMKGIASQKLLSDLTLMRAVPGHELPSFESPVQGSILLAQLSAARGPLQSAAKIDPGDDALRTVAFAPVELAEVAQQGRARRRKARMVWRSGAVFESLTLIAGLDDVA